VAKYALETVILLAASLPLSVLYYQSSMLIICYLRQVSLATDSVINKTRLERKTEYVKN
jgi:hypothetical protein